MWRAFPLLLLACVVTLCAAQDLTKYTIEVVSTSHKFTEGPVWSAHDGLLLFSDIPANQILKIDPKGRTVFREQSGGANGNAFDDKGRLYTCEGRSRRVTRTNKNGSVEVLADNFEGKKLNGPNDIIVGKNEHVYFTDPAFGVATENRELPFFGVFHIPPKGPVQAVLRLDTRPNGIALSTDGKILYVADSDSRSIRAYDVQKDGSLGPGRTLIQKTEGVPDGIEVDENGNLFVAAGEVLIYSPGGELIGTIQMAEKPSNLVFGDGDLKTLYVTARSTLYRVRMEAKGVALY